MTDDQVEVDPLDVWCPTCGARRGEQCLSLGARRPQHTPHKQRATAAAGGPPRQRNEVPRSSRDAVRARSGGQCEVRIGDVCTGRAMHQHHKEGRRTGGHEPSNLLDLCWPCHDFVHAHPAISYDHGWMVRMGVGR